MVDELMHSLHILDLIEDEVFDTNDTNDEFHHNDLLEVEVELDDLEVYDNAQVEVELDDNEYKQQNLNLEQNVVYSELDEIDEVVMLHLMHSLDDENDEVTIKIEVMLHIIDEVDDDEVEIDYVDETDVNEQ